MDLFDLEPGCYKVYVDFGCCSHDYYDTIKIDENYEIYLQENSDLTGSVKRGIDNSVYLHFEERNDPSVQYDFYYRASFDDVLLFFGTDEYGKFDIELKKLSECVI